MKKSIGYIFSVLITFLHILSCKDDDTDFGTPVDLAREYAGGETTIFTMSNIAYSSPAANLTTSDLQLHLIGDTEFEQIFVSAPAPLNQGLGPVYNNSSCIKCHPSDGRGKFPQNINSFSSLLFRISIPGEDQHSGPLGVPGFGTQAQNHAVPGFIPELDYVVNWIEFSETLADGTVVQMRKPNYSFTNTYQEIPANTMISARIAPPIFGLGLLEFITEEDILSDADEFDLNQDGISGKANYVWNPIHKQMELGRFGWKANVSDIEMQVIMAYHEDMGISNYVFPFDVPSDDLDDNPEISGEIIAQVIFYCRTLAVPAARNVDDVSVNRGYHLFQEINCSKCHKPMQSTGSTPISALSNQVFYPFTDMLLHDMGEMLSDHRPDYKAQGNEWKTRPLWGIGMQQIVNGHTEYLHDGRARNITEAILWHGGEAQSSRNEFKNLSTTDREDLLKFLNSL